MLLVKVRFEYKLKKAKDYKYRIWPSGFPDHQPSNYKPTWLLLANKKRQHKISPCVNITLYTLTNCVKGRGREPENLFEEESWDYGNSRQIRASYNKH